MRWSILLVVFIFAVGACHSHAEFHAANMTLMSGQVVALDELYKAANWTCCVPRSVLGDYTPIVRLDSSAGQYYVTKDPYCKDIVAAADYPATFEAIYMCGRNFSTQSRCRNGGCPSVDGGLNLALPGDWCVDSNNSQDPMILCSTAAPVCDAGYSGKCITLPNNATASVPDAPIMTLQSGLVINLQQLQQEYEGQCCLPRSVITDYTPVARFDNTDGKYFVSNDASCSSPITTTMYPAMYEYIWVCGDRCPDGGCADDDIGLIDGGVTRVPAGGTCDPYNYYTSGCWGAAPMCSFANQCIGIDSYNYYWDSNPDGWGYYRPRWWRPLAPIYRPYWREPSVFHHHPPGWRAGWRPRPADWIPGRPIHGWKPGHRPDTWEPADGWNPGRGWQPGMHRGGKPLGPVHTPPHRDNGRDHHQEDSLPGTRNGPGIILPSAPGHNTNPNTPGQPDNPGTHAPGRDSENHGIPSTGDNPPGSRGGWWQGGRPAGTDAAGPHTSSPSHSDSSNPGQGTDPTSPTSDSAPEPTSNPGSTETDLPGISGTINPGTTPGAITNPVNPGHSSDQQSPTRGSSSSVLSGNTDSTATSRSGDLVSRDPGMTPDATNARPISGDWGNLFGSAGRGTSGTASDGGAPFSGSDSTRDPAIPATLTNPSTVFNPGESVDTTTITQPVLGPTSPQSRSSSPYSGAASSSRPWVIRPAAGPSAGDPVSTNSPFTTGRPAASSGFPVNSEMPTSANSRATPAWNSNPVAQTATPSFTPRTNQQPSLTPSTTTGSSLFGGSSLGRSTNSGNSIRRNSGADSSWGRNSWGSSGSAAPAPLLWQPSSTGRPAAPTTSSISRGWGSGSGPSGFSGSGFGSRSSNFGVSSMGQSSRFGGDGFGSGRSSGGGFVSGRSGFGRGRKLSAMY